MLESLKKAFAKTSVGKAEIALRRAEQAVTAAQDELADTE